MGRDEKCSPIVPPGVYPSVAERVNYTMEERAVTATEPRDTIAIEEALTLIDQGLGRLGHRELVSASEATDLLLDLRSVLAASKAFTAEVPVSN